MKMRLEPAKVSPAAYHAMLGVEELEILYRETGPRDAPTWLDLPPLLRPSSALFAKLLFLVEFCGCMLLTYLMRPSINKDHRSCTTQRAIPARGFWTVGFCAELFSWDRRWSEPNESLGRL